MSYISSKLHNIVKKFLPFDSKLEIYPNGENNDYVENIEFLKNNSITATMASNIMVQYIIGKGFGTFDNVKIGNDKLSVITEKITESIVDLKGVAVKVNYNANLEIANWSVLPFSTCRVGKKDSKEYNGKILFSNNWQDVKKNKPVPYNVYNPDKSVLAYQIGITDKDNDIAIIEKVQKFGGQILYINLMPKYYYPLARIDAVKLDCSTENLCSLYVNNLLEGGFFPRTLVVTRPFVSNDLIEDSIRLQDPVLQGTLRRAESEKENFERNVQGMLGVRNVKGVMTMQIDFKGEKLEDAILVKSLDSNMKPDLFLIQLKLAQERILMAFNNLPVTLVKASEGLFSNSGDALNVAKQSYYENTTKERSIVETIVNDLLRATSGVKMTDDLKLIPLITKEISTDNALFEEQKAQATLKGSVGGVTALLEIIRTVSTGETDYNSAIAIIQETYGVDEIKAKELLGTPNTTPNATN